MEKEDQNSFEFYKLIPNMITLSALCLGLLAIRLAIIGNFESAAICVIVACLFDGVDGNVARRLNAANEFGAQMDSLADFFNFGIAPGFLVYFWKMQEYDAIKRVAWFPVLLLAICMAIRLARFNVALSNEDKENPLNKYFFKGIPAPMAASLVLFPMIVSFEFPCLEVLFANPLFVIINTTIIALLSGSTIPTPCFKKIKFKSSQRQLILILISILLIGMLINVWLFGSIICTFYILSIFVSWIFYFKFKKLNNNK